MSGPRPISILIAALGGEGGGVLTDWIVAAAAELGFPVQSTSIPGVAQRTGATTYYIEIVPVPEHELPARPVLALAPGVGDVDIVLASELLEAGRTIASGFVTPDRTLMIASTARSYLVVEKMAMGDGRYDSARLTKAIETHAQSHILFDMEALAKQSGAVVNAVMLGSIAGCARLPIPADAFERAIRADGKAVDANLRGFRAGLDAAAKAHVPRVDDKTHRRPAADALAELERGIVAPPAARDVVVAGVRRLAAYQDVAYAQLYLDRLAPIRAADARAQAGGRLVRETARHLALRMSYEDVIRVAQAKINPARLERIFAELGVQPRRAVHGDRVPQARHRGAVLAPSARARQAHPCARRAARPDRAPALGDGGQHHVGIGLSAHLAAGQAAPLASEILPLPRRATRDRRLAQPHRRGGTAFGRSRARDRRMRAAHQGLR
jgi:indolepyruvate ferredoxin oxidoreductase beta subunit